MFHVNEICSGWLWLILRMLGGPWHRVTVNVGAHLGPSAHLCWFWFLQSSTPTKSTQSSSFTTPQKTNQKGKNIIQPNPIFLHLLNPTLEVIQPHVSWTHLLKKGLDSRLIGLGARKARWAHAYGENTSNPWTCLISMHWRITTCFVFILFLKWLKPNHPALIRIFLIFGQSDCNQMYWLFFAKCPG